MVVIQVNRSKHSINETQVMEQRKFSFGIKEQLMVILQNVNDVEQNREREWCRTKERTCFAAESSVCVTSINYCCGVREEEVGLRLDIKGFMWIVFEWEKGSKTCFEPLQVPRCQMFLYFRCVTGEREQGDGVNALRFSIGASRWVDELHRVWTSRHTDSTTDKHHLHAPAHPYARSGKRALHKLRVIFLANFWPPCPPS